MHEYKGQLEELKVFIANALKTVNLPQKKAELVELNSQMQATDFWDNSDKAQVISRKASHTGKSIKEWEGIQNECDELLEILPEISEEKDPEAAKEFTEMVEAILKDWRRLEVSTFLNGKYDGNNAILMIHAGTGGTDAADFAEMLLRMYLRYGERMEFSTEIIEKSVGDEAGIKSATVTIKGQFAYGYLKGEAGVHRLVRLSPFNSKNTRETSFVLVEILPEIEHDTDVAINQDDLRIDVFRAGGKGGQSVNTTDSAVRITHLPTGVVVSCQNERSQLQNKEHAMRILQGRLVDLMVKEQAEELKDLKGGKVEMSWGNQIRSYVLHPYKMVKDHRTKYEENNPDKVLDGEIEGFVEAELKGGI